MAYKYFNSYSIHLKNLNGIFMNGQKPFTGITFSLFPNTSDTAQISCFKNGKENGLWQQFYANGKKKQQRYFLDGIKVKTDSAWWENGQLQFVCKFENGEYEGELKEWNAQGVLIREMHYKKGYEEGAQKQFYDNGKVRSNYIMRNGKRIGLLGTKNCVNVSDSIFTK
ncbi:MAG TPA: hypothetical protein VGB95_07495 [Chitinophagales bacterium]